jgi:hypothetical protein
MRNKVMIGEGEIRSSADDTLCSSVMFRDEIPLALLLFYITQQTSQGEFHSMLISGKAITGSIPFDAKKLKKRESNCINKNLEL